MCTWVTMLYSRKLTEHCKLAIMKKRLYKKKKTKKEMMLGKPNIYIQNKIGPLPYNIHKNRLKTGLQT